MQIHYHNHIFIFEPLPDQAFTGRLQRDHKQRELLAALTNAEDEDWYLDSTGERLPTAQLFARSPWSYSSESGPRKLLCRFLNLHTGSVHFDTPEHYAGEMFAWMRNNPTK